MILDHNDMIKLSPLLHVLLKVCDLTSGKQLNVIEKYRVKIPSIKIVAIGLFIKLRNKRHGF